MYRDIPAIKKASGGIRIDVVKDALKAGADILVVGREADEFLD